jgi:hypothetical protein
MQAEEILSFTPEEIFCNPNTLNEEFHKLTKIWHPDRNPHPKANEVLIHLNLSKKLAEEKIKKGIWQAPNTLTLKRIAASDLIVKFKKHHTFELGDMYIGDNFITYIIKPVNEDLIRNFEEFLKNFQFASNEMEQEFKKYLPKIKQSKDSLQSGDKILIIKKNPDQILLKDLINYVKILDPKHTAWIISRLLNFACYLQFSNLSLNDISLNNIWITPAEHTIALLGGWWYASIIGKRLKAVPNRTLNFLSPKTLSTKITSEKTDLELIRVVARELIGDKTGVGKISGIPESIVNWARYPSSGIAKDDYSYWMNVVLPAAFGKRVFTPLNITAEQIYGA